MKLVTFEADNSTRVGALLCDDVVDLSTALGVRTMLEFLSAGTSMLMRAEEIVKGGAYRLPLTKATIVAPISNPGKILCIGMNYREHCIEQNFPIPTEPVIFSKFNSAITGPNSSVYFDSSMTQEMDWEVEMVIVIGKEGKFIKKENAMDYVVGYTVAHDVSARDWQLKKNGGQWLLGKTMDTFFPFGPAIVTKGSISDPHNLGIRCYVNDSVVQNSNTNELIFKTEDLLAYISQFVTLKPGDLISTGTPSGVGCFRKPPVWLQHGDKVRCEIDELGVVRNHMVDMSVSKH